MKSLDCLVNERLDLGLLLAWSLDLPVRRAAVPNGWRCFKQTADPTVGELPTPGALKP